jgi:hypothetical protein
MKCARCGEVLSCDGCTPPAICWDCYSPRAAYCGETLWAWVLKRAHPQEDRGLSCWVAKWVYLWLSTGVACLRQHWTSHKRLCRVLAQHELTSFSSRHTPEEINRIWNHPEPSELPLYLKLSAILWTLRPRYKESHIISLVKRAALFENGHPAPGDTKETLLRLLKRATTELPWPELPEGTQEMFKTYFGALSTIAVLGEPEAAVGMLSRHVEDVESKVVDRKYVAKYYIYRLGWLLSAAWKVKEDEGKRGAYVAEARGVMGRAMRSLRDLQVEDFDDTVSDSPPSGDILYV